MNKLITLIMVLLLCCPCSAPAGGEHTTYGYFYKPDYGAKGPVDYNAFNAALDATDTFLYGLSGLAEIVAGWVVIDNVVTLCPATPTYSDNNTFTLSGDYTSRFPSGAVVQVEVAAGMVFSTVSSSSYSAPTTTVNLNDTVLTNPITRVYVVATRDGLWPNGPGWVVARDYGTDRAALAAADAVASAAGKLLLITVAYTIDDDLTLASKLQIMPGAVLSVSTTKTLTINGTLDAGRYPIFSFTGTGTVAFGNLVPEVYPEWYGAVPDNTTDSVTYLQKALDTHSVVHLAKGIYKISTELYPKENAVIYGEGPSSVIYRYTTTGGYYAAGLCPYNYVTLRNFTLRGSGASYVSGANGITVLYDDGGWTDPLNSVTRSTIVMSEWRGAHLSVENVLIENWAAHGLTAGPWSMIKDVTIEDCLHNGMLLVGAHTQISNPKITGCSGWAIEINSSYVQVNGGTIYNCGDETSWPASVIPYTQRMGGIAINGHTHSAGTVGNRIVGTTIDTSDGPGVFVYAPFGYDFALTDTIIDSVTVRNVNVDATSSVAGINITDLSTSGTKLDRVAINNVTVNGTTNGHGIRVYGARNVTIDNYHINNVSGGGIYLYTGTVAWRGIHIGKGTIYASNTVGIYAYNGTSLTISGYDITGLTSASARFGIYVSAVRQFNVGAGVIDLDDFATSYGIYITGSSGHGIVSGAVIVDAQTGIFDESTGGYTIKTGNHLSFVNTNPIVELGTRTGFHTSQNLGVAVPEYANNAAALAAGKVAGELYRITGTDHMGVVYSGGE